MTEATPRERRHARTRDAILSAARELVVEKGQDKLTLREIARRIDYSPAGLYEYFSNKDDIIGALCDDGTRRLAAYLATVPTDLPPAERFLEVGLAYLEFARGNPELYMLIFTQLTATTAAPDPSNVPQDSAFGILLDAIQAGIDAGDFSTQPGYGVLEIALGAWSLVHGIAMLQLTQLREMAPQLGPVNHQILKTFRAGL